MDQCITCKNEFTATQLERELCKKMDIEPLEQCYVCRRILRFLWRNESTLYQSACALCRKQIISSYSPKSKYVVYCEDCWWSDAWDATQWGSAFDPNRSFFEQFSDLMSTVPRPNLATSNNTNCAFVNYVNYSKGCYFTFGCHAAENCLFGWRTQDTKDSVDCSQMDHCELCYAAIDCERCYNVRYSHGCQDCGSSAFLLNCKNCIDCFGCINLTRKSYCIFNTQYTKDEYETKMKEYDFTAWSGVQKAKKDFSLFIAQHPWRYARILNSEDCTGDNILNSKNVQRGFTIARGEQCVDFYLGRDVKDSISCDMSGWPGELLFNSTSAGVGDNNVKCTSVCWSCARTEYSDNCHSSEDLFGCVGVKRGQYCILNKKYPREEYQKVKEQIIESMRARSEYGYFFPAAIAPYAYNESVAQDYYPLTKEKAVEHGFPWQDDMPGTRGNETIQADRLADSIADVADTIVNEILVCALCFNNYKIIKQELIFYRRQGIPLPRICPKCRIRERLQSKTSFDLWHRQCMCDKVEHDHVGRCPTEFESTYAPERSELVFCEACYQKEVV